ncbi:MAG: alkene reductase [bacterium]
MKKDLFTPIRVGPYELPNRIFMAPMTRNRAPETVPTQMIATYYQQRATAGLIITEASQISPQGVGYPATPGIHNNLQVKGWKVVADAVHSAGGHIFLQLWHVGRISHPDYHGGALPVAPSAIAPKGQVATYAGMKPFATPRALETSEIPGIVEQYRHAAKNAMNAGFDGVEIHGANGYLLDQFLRHGSNQRTDEYGGSVENRARLLLQVTAAVVSEWGKGKVGVRLSPSGTVNDMSDSDPETTFTYVANKLSSFHLAYLHVVDALEGDIRHGAKVVPLPSLRKAYRGTLVVNGGYDKARGHAVIEAGTADAVAFGQWYISNPDLVQRLKNDAPLNPPDFNTFYGGGEKGYTDYPTLSQSTAV